MQEECLTLEQIASGKEYVYYYTLATRFLDKYGNRTAVSYFEPGRVITVGEKDDQGKVTQVQISDAVWEYPDVSRYSVDMDRGIFKIGDERYSYDADLYICEDDLRKQLSDLTELDTLRVTGIGKKTDFHCGYDRTWRACSDQYGSFLREALSRSEAKLFCGSDQRYDNGAAGRHLYCDGGK